MREPTKEIAALEFESEIYDIWRVAKYRVFEGKNGHQRIVLGHKMHKVVRGVHIEKLCREAIAAAKANR